MSNSSEPSLNSKLVYREEKILSDQMMADNLLKMKNVSDEIITHNMLKISIAINIGIIIFNFYLLFFSHHVLDSDDRRVNRDISIVGISFRFIKVIHKNSRDNQEISLLCVENDACKKSESCNSLISFTDITDKYNLSCEDLYNFKNSGLIYLVLSLFGNILTIISSINIFLLLYRKLPIYYNELINVFVRWDTLAYFVNIILYPIHSRVLFSSNIHFGYEIILAILIIILSLINFFCVKSNISQKMRINTRRSFIEENNI